MTEIKLNVGQRVSFGFAVFYRNGSVDDISVPKVASSHPEIATVELDAGDRRRAWITGHGHGACVVVVDTDVQKPLMFKVTIADPIHTRNSYALRDTMFAMTFAARMLRRLQASGEMKQADFMRQYHVLCNRPPKQCYRCKGIGFDVVAPTPDHIERRPCDRCKGVGTLPSSPSSFGNNFGHFCLTWSPHNIAVIEQRRLEDHGHHDRRVRIAWVGPTMDQMLAACSDEELLTYYERLERAFATDHADPTFAPEVGGLMNKLRTEGARRAC